MQVIIDFVLAHQVLLSSLVVAVLDLVFALNPNANAPDGVLHAVYLFLKPKAKE